MARTIAMSIHGNEWGSMGLDSALDMDFAEYCNERESGYGDMEGEWYVTAENYSAPDGKVYHVLFTGTHGNDHSPGTMGNTRAQLFDVSDPDDMAEFKDDLAKWESKPEYDPAYDESELEESDDDDESELDEESRLDSERQAERDEEGSNWTDGPTALVVQKFGAVRKEYGPFPVAIGPDFDECGLERSVLEEVTRAARIEGAEIGYCDIIIHDADGNELDTETAVI